jgi:hypothetical protein
MVGDILMLSVYTPLHETKTSLKGGQMSLNNTGYKIVVQDSAGIIDMDGLFGLTALSEETARQEAWINRSFPIRANGTAVIRFVPTSTAAEEKAFPHTLRIVAFPKKPPK